MTPLDSLDRLCWSSESASPEPHEGVRSGIDIVSVAEVTRNIARFGERYCRRLFSSRELEESRAESPQVFERSLAARFAAKEATFKVLRVGERQPAWIEVEVRRIPAGGCSITLHGTAREMASEIGITELALSLSHEGDVAAAFVVALCRDPQSTMEA